MLTKHPNTLDWFSWVQSIQTAFEDTGAILYCPYWLFLGSHTSEHGTTHTSCEAGSLSSQSLIVQFRVHVLEFLPTHKYVYTYVRMYTVWHPPDTHYVLYTVCVHTYYNIMCLNIHMYVHRNYLPTYVCECSCINSYSTVEELCY